MSLFKTREWWAGQCGSAEEFDRGCLAVANVDNSSDGDVKIITGSFQGFLRIFSPKKRESKPEDLLLEQNLGQPILQVEVGRFLGHDLGLAVLHPRKLAVYAVKSVSGVGEQGSYMTAERKYEHNLDRTSGNMTYGPFGGVTGKDFIAVQSMDGMLFVYEQDCMAFSRFLPNFLLPGPLCYVPKIDAFVTCNSQMAVECYKYQVLASSSNTNSQDSGITSSKRFQVEWSLNVGEQVVDIFVSRFSRSLTSTQVDIVVLCERSLFCLKENGTVRFQKLFDYPTACCCPYAVGNTGTGNGGASGTSGESSQQIQHNMIVASHLDSLMIYKDVQLVWASKVVGVPVSIRVAKFSGLAGLMVTLNDTGALAVSYLGTDPSNSIVNNPVEGKELNYDEMDKELRSLQLLIREASQNVKTEPTDKIALRAQEVSMEPTEIPTCCFRLYISYTGMGSLQNVNIAISTTDAVKVSQSAITIDTLLGGNTSKTPTVIPLVFRCKTNSMPSERTATVVAAYTTGKGEPRTARLEITLPLALFCKIVPPIKTSIYKLTIDTGRRGGPLLATLFDDLAPPSGVDVLSPSNEPDAPNMISIQYHSGPDVTIIGSKSSGKFRVQSSHFEAMWLLLSELISRLQKFWKDRDAAAPKDASPSSSSEHFRISFTDELPFQEFFALIDSHFNGRKEMDGLREELEKCTTQFRAIQKRLLVRYKDRNAVPLLNMDILLESTYQDICILTTKMQAKQKEIKTLACNLACAIQLVQRLIRYKFDLDNTSFLILQSYLPARVNDSNVDVNQGWEESTDASLVQLLRTVLASSAQDVATLPVLTTLMDTKILKQHIAMVTDRLAAGGKLYKPHTSRDSKKKSSEKASSSKSRASAKARA